MQLSFDSFAALEKSFLRDLIIDCDVLKDHSRAELFNELVSAYAKEYALICCTTRMDEALERDDLDEFFLIYHDIHELHGNPGKVAKFCSQHGLFCGSADIKDREDKLCQSSD